MDKYKVMENITNGLLAANKVQKAFSPIKQDSRNGDISLYNNPQLGEVLEIIADHSPRKYKDTLSSTLGKCNTYTNTYKELKKNFGLTRSKGVNGDAIASTLSAMRPVTNPQGKLLISKMLQIYEILKS